MKSFASGPVLDRNTDLMSPLVYLTWILGLGVSHLPMVEDFRGHSYGKPLTTMRNYLQLMVLNQDFKAGRIMVMILEDLILPLGLVTVVD